MKVIWAPWRIEYLKAKKEKGCVLCKRSRGKQDQQSYILHRGKKNFVILNRYPYINGHLMVVPYRHTARFEDLREDEMAEHHQLIRKSVLVLKKAFKPHGFNIGMNIGQAGGAGIAEHLHMHVVPRWPADTGCMPVLADTRSLPQYLQDTYKILKKGWVNL
ncbi:MAG: HIT domain-containing protein [Deltaproteobacteria bacterium]|nr:HIT domain-containing protein [Deltaproteobacteria bacterium]